jgi:hypothetical protein
MKDKKREKLLIGAIGLFLILAVMPVTAYAVPGKINFQGFLTDSGGNPINNQTPGVDITFSIYDTCDSIVNGECMVITAAAVWNETHLDVEVVNGIFSVVLGISSALDASDLDGDRWLGVNVEGSGEMTPYQQLTSVAYALQASDLNCTNPSGCVSETELSFIPGDITAVTAGTGLTGGATEGAATLNADTSYLQRRVSGSCPPGESIRIISSTGTVTCEFDNDTGDITGVTAGNGLSGGGSSGSVTLNVGAGTGISVSANTVNADTSYLESNYLSQNGDTIVRSSSTTLFGVINNGTGGAIFGQTSSASSYAGEFWGKVRATGTIEADVGVKTPIYGGASYTLTSSGTPATQYVTPTHNFCALTLVSVNAANPNSQRWCKASPNTGGYGAWTLEARTGGGTTIECGFYCF